MGNEAKTGRDYFNASATSKSHPAQLISPYGAHKWHREVNKRVIGVICIMRDLNYRSSLFLM